MDDAVRIPECHGIVTSSWPAAQGVESITFHLDGITVAGGRVGSMDVPVLDLCRSATPAAIAAVILTAAVPHALGLGARRTHVVTTVPVGGLLVGVRTWWDPIAGVTVVVGPLVGERWDEFTDDAPIGLAHARALRTWVGSLAAAAVPVWCSGVARTRILVGGHTVDERPYHARGGVPRDHWRLGTTPCTAAPLRERAYAISEAATELDDWHEAGEAHRLVTVVGSATVESLRTARGARSTVTFGQRPLEVIELESVRVADVHAAALRRHVEALALSSQAPARN